MKNRIGEDLVSAEIGEIAWDGILLHLDVTVVRKHFPAERDIQFYMVSERLSADAAPVTQKDAGDLWHLTLNVTNPGNRSCLPAGRYTVLVCSGEEILCKASVSRTLAPHLAERSRIFRHGGPTAAYCVGITAETCDGALLPVFRVFDAKKEELKAFSPDSVPEESAGPKKQALPD